MEFDQVVRKRKMIRKYLYPIWFQIVSIISKMIRNASKAPSSGHIQVQEFIIVRDSAIKKKLRQVSVNQKYVENAPVLVVVYSNTSHSIGRHGHRERDFYSIIDGAFALWSFCSLQYINYNFDPNFFILLIWKDKIVFSVLLAASTGLSINYPFDLFL